MTKDKYEEFGCEFKNEADCEEELEQADESLERLEEENFGE